MRYTTRPLSDRTWLRSPAQRKASPFSGSWSSTLETLAREVKMLRGREVVIEVDVPERGIRLDGQLRADAKVDEPAVVVAFDTPQHGPMLYRCDRYFAGAHRPRGDSWQHNVRAIALTLESLRAVDRYGATETGQQYTGFKAIGAGRAMPASHMTRSDAAELLERVAIGDEGDARERSVQRIRDGGPRARDVWKHARAEAHPDRRGGDRTLWDQIEQAAQVLGVSS
ncbi:hypothetical protein [Microcystis phage MinS1]|nr:hypothetical protein [Microcystis phage MinS1]